MTLFTNDVPERGCSDRSLGGLFGLFERMSSRERRVSYSSDGAELVKRAIGTTDVPPLRSGRSVRYWQAAAIIVTDETSSRWAPAIELARSVELPDELVFPVVPVVVVEVVEAVDEAILPVTCTRCPT